MAGPLTTQAQQEALVRYGPQRFALRELIAQAVQARDMALHAAAGADRGIQAAIAAARGETRAAYGQAAQTTVGTRSTVDSALSGLGAGASPFAAAIARERGGAQDRLTEGRNNSLQELTQRRLESASGRAYATQHATDQFNTDIGKVQRSYQELAGEEGAFTQGRVGELKKEQADRQFQRDLAEFTQGQENKRARLTARTQRQGQQLQRQGQQQTQGLSRAKFMAQYGITPEEAAKGVAPKRGTDAKGSPTIGPNGPKLATQDAHTGLWNDVQAAEIDAKKQKALGRSPGEIRDLLTSGRSKQQITDPQKTDAAGKPIKLTVPGIKAHDRLATLIATDLAFHPQGITRKTMDVLHKHGFSLRQLGLKVYSGPGRGQGGPQGTGIIGG